MKAQGTGVDPTYLLTPGPHPNLHLHLHLHQRQIGKSGQKSGCIASGISESGHDLRPWTIIGSDNSRGKSLAWKRRNYLKNTKYSDELIPATARNLRVGKFAVWFLRVGKQTFGRVVRHDNSKEKTRQDFTGEKMFFVLWIHFLPYFLIFFGISWPSLVHEIYIFLWNAIREFFLVVVTRISCQISLANSQKPPGTTHSRER